MRRWLRVAYKGLRRKGRHAAHAMAMCGCVPVCVCVCVCVCLCKKYHIKCLEFSLELLPHACLSFSLSHSSFPALAFACSKSSGRLQRLQLKRPTLSQFHFGSASFAFVCALFVPLSVVLTLASPPRPLMLLASRLIRLLLFVPSAFPSGTFDLSARFSCVGGQQQSKQQQQHQQVR